MADIKLFEGMRVETEPTAHYHLEKNDLIVLDQLIYRIVDSHGTFGDPLIVVEPVWSFTTDREASGVKRDFHPEGDVKKVVLAH